MQRYFSIKKQDNKLFLNDDDLKKPSLRISFSHFNTIEDIDYLVEVLKNV